MNVEEIVEKLKEGNEKWKRGEIASFDVKKVREELLEGQHPYAAVITCSDSRVVPEYIFSAKPGELFVIRTAGNVLDDIALGSVEYAVEHLKVGAIIILGHQKCGAVTATCEGGEEKGNLKKILEKIQPACQKASGEVEKAVIENLSEVERDMLERSEIIKEAVEKGETKILKAKYMLDSGEVIFY